MTTEVTNEDKVVTAGLKRLRQPISLRGMSKPEARVAIARDVLAALDAKKIFPRRGGYGVVRFNETTGAGIFHSREENLRELLGRASICEACALGSACLALVGRENKLTIPAAHGTAFIQNSDFRAQLRQYFSRLQIAMIESAHEGMSFAHSEDFAQEDYQEKIGGFWKRRSVNPMVRNAIDRAIEFNKYAGVGQWGADTSMRRIFQNIIDNKGTFIP